MIEEKQMKTVKVVAAIICDDIKEKNKYAFHDISNSTLFRIFSETKSSWNKDIYFPVTCNNVAFKNKGGDKMHLSPSCYLLSLILFYRKLLF